MSRDDEVALADLRDWTSAETRWAKQGGKVKGTPTTLAAIRDAACEAVVDRSMPLFGRATHYWRARSASFALGQSNPLLDRLRAFIASGHGEDDLRGELGDAFIGLLVDSRFAVEASLKRSRAPGVRS